MLYPPKFAIVVLIILNSVLTVHIIWRNSWRKNASKCTNLHVTIQNSSGGYAPEPPRWEGLQRPCANPSPSALRRCWRSIIVYYRSLEDVRLHLLERASTTIVRTFGIGAPAAVARDNCHWKIGINGPPLGQLVVDIRYRLLWSLVRRRTCIDDPSLGIWSPTNSKRVDWYIFRRPTRPDSQNSSCCCY